MLDGLGMMTSTGFVCFCQSSSTVTPCMAQYIVLNCVLVVLTAHVRIGKYCTSPRLLRLCWRMNRPDLVCVDYMLSMCSKLKYTLYSVFPFPSKYFEQQIEIHHLWYFEVPVYRANDDCVLSPPQLKTCLTKLKVHLPRAGECIPQGFLLSARRNRQLAVGRLYVGQINFTMYLWLNPHNKRKRSSSALEPIQESANNRQHLSLKRDYDVLNIFFFISRVR